MKKILSLLTVLTLTASGTSGVISCDIASNPRSEDLKKANSIAASLNGKLISFPQQGQKTKATDYKTTIIAQLKSKVAGNYDFIFNGDDKNINLTRTQQPIKINIVVNNVPSTTVATINMKFSDSSDITKANRIAGDLNGKSIAFKQQEQKTKANDYKTTIITKLKNEVAGDYTITFNGDDGNITLTKTNQPIKINVIVNAVPSTTVATINMKLSDSSDTVKANNIATALKDSSIILIKENAKTKASEYKDKIQEKLNDIVSQTPTVYSFEFSPTDQGDITLYNTDQTFSIKIQVGTAKSNEINIKIKLVLSDLDKANGIAGALNGKSISFMQKDIKTQAKDYIPEIKAQLKTKKDGDYTITFATLADGEKNLSALTDTPINIKIIVNETTSTTIATINMKFSDNSDIAKANMIAGRLNNQLINLTKIASKTKAKNYKSEIQTELDGIVSQTPTVYLFEFASVSEGETTLTTSYQTFAIKIKVGVAESNAINIQIKLNLSDLEKANNIATTLKNAVINPIKLNINANKQKLSDYFQSDIKALLDAKLTTEEKTYNYSLVNTQNITNIAQDFNVKIQIGSAISTVEFTIKVQFNYTKINGDLNTKTIYITRELKNKIYVGTNTGLYVSSDSTGANFFKVSSIPSNSEINTIEEINNKIYIGTNAGVYLGDGTGANFSQISTSVIGNANINIIKLIDNIIYVGTNAGLYLNDGTGAGFIKASGISNDNIKTIINIKISNNIYVGTNTGLYISGDRRNFASFPVIPSDTLIYKIKEISGKVYIATNAGLYVSDSTGFTFTQVNSIGNININSIQKINNEIYVGTNSGLYFSNDSTGTNFTKITGDLATKTIYAIQLIGSKIYVGTNSGLYVSSDNGISFLKVDSITNASVVTITEINNIIYIGTRNSGGLYYNFTS